MVEMCGALYDRALAMNDSQQREVFCTYVKGHPTPRHSWETLRLQDEADRTVHSFSLRGIPPDVEALLTNIEEGKGDPYLEVILLVCHNRKKALRNVPGFGHEH